jgi:predicted phosphodiesterase
MRLAVISDIHANLEALKQVLRDLDRQSVDAVVSLGDNIGYGPDPEAVLELIRERNIPSVMGNHELGIVNPVSLSHFNPAARLSLEITWGLLSPRSIDFLKTLKTSCVVGRCWCVHGFPPHSVNMYLYQAIESRLRRAFLELEQEVCFVGHTHELIVIGSGEDRPREIPLKQGRNFLPEGYKYIVNAGSVGQPRDGNNRAKYVIWDDETRILEIRYIPYDIAATAKKILELGFPEFNARRLW